MHVLKGKITHLPVQLTQSIERFSDAGVVQWTREKELARKTASNIEHPLVGASCSPQGHKIILAREENKRRNTMNALNALVGAISARKDLRIEYEDNVAFLWF